MATPGQYDANLTLGADFAPEVESKLQRRLSQWEKGMKVNLSLGDSLKSMGQFDKSLESANRRVLTLGASFLTITSSLQLFRGIIDATVKTEQSLRDINSVFQLTTVNLDKFSRGLFDVARQTSQSFETAAEAAKEFSRQGLSAEETLKRTRDAMVLTRLAGLDAAESVQTLTAALNGFQKGALNSTQIVNKLATVDAAFAVSSRDLAQGLARSGAAAADAGVSFDQLVGLITAAQQTTARGGAVIGNALKTIFTRVERKDTIDALETLGIRVKDLQGNALSTIQVLQNFAKAYDTLGSSTKQRAAELLGSVYQINTLKAVLGDLSKENGIYAQSQRISATATDEAIRRNDALNKSLASILQNYQTTNRQVFANVGNLTIQSPLKTAVGALTNNPITDALKDATGNAETIGGQIAEKVLKGFGNSIIFGILPLVSKALASASFRLIKQTAQYAGEEAGLQNILVTKKQQEQRILSEINTLYKRGGDELRQQLALMGGIEAKAAHIREILANNASVAATEQYEAASIARKLSGRGATGYIPHAAGGYSDAMSAESRAISAGVGGAPSSARPVLIPDFNFGNGSRGPMVANSSEFMVRNFAGGSAIFNQDMIGRFGLPPGAKPIAAGGYVPNAATGLTSQDTLALQQIAARPGGFEGFIKGLDISGINFDTQAKSYRKKLTQAVEQALDINISELAPVAKKSYYKLVSEVLRVRGPEIEQIRSEQVAARNIAVENTLYGEFSKGVKIFRNDRGLPKASPESRAALEAEMNASRPVGVPSSLVPVPDYLLPPGQRTIPSTPRMGALGRFRNWANANSGSIQNKALIAAIGAPFLAGLIPEGQGGTVAGRVGGAGSGALNGLGAGAGIGATLGPIGAIVGAVGGLLVGGVLGASQKWNKSFEELAKEIENANAKNAEQINAASNYVAAQGEIGEAIRSGASPKRVQELIAQQSSTLLRVSNPADRSALLRASGNDQALADVLSSINLRNIQSVASNDVRSVFGRAREGNGLFKSGGNSAADLESIAQQLSVAANVPANRDVFERFKKDSPDNPVKAFSDLAKSFGQTQEQIDEELKGFEDTPDKFKIVLARFREIAEQQIKDSLVSAQNLEQKAAQLNLAGVLRDSAANLGAAAQTGEQSSLLRIRSNLERSRSLVQIGTPNGISQLRQLNSLQLASAQQENAVRYNSAFQSRVAGVLNQAASQTESKFLPAGFLQGLQGARNENDLRDLAGTLNDSSKELRKTLLDAYKELVTLREQGAQELQAQKETLRIQEIQAQLEQRNNILANSRYNQAGSDQFFQAFQTGKTAQIGRYGRAQQGSGLLDVIGSLDRGGLPETASTQALRDAIRTDLARSDFADKLSTILGKNVQDSGIEKAVAEVLARPVRSIQDATNRDVAQRIGLATQGLKTSPAEALKQIGTSGGVLSAISSGKISFGEGGIVTALTSGLGENSPVVSVLNKIYEKIGGSEKEVATQSNLTNLRTKVVNAQGKLQGLQANSLENALSAIFGPESDDALRPSRIAQVFPSNRPKFATGMATDITAMASSDRGKAFVAEQFRKSKNLSETYQKLTGGEVSELTTILGPSQNPKNFVDNLLKSSPYGAAFKGISPNADIAQAQKDYSAANAQYNAAQSQASKAAALAYLGRNASTKRGTWDGVVPSLVTGFNMFGASGRADQVAVAAGYRERVAAGLPSEASSSRLSAVQGLQRQLGATSLEDELRQAKELGSSEEEIYQIKVKRIEAERQLQFLQKNALDDASRIRAENERDLKILLDKRAALLANPNATQAEIGAADLTIARQKGLQGDSVGSLKGGFASQFDGLKREFNDLSQIGAQIGQSLQSGLSNAFGDFITGAKSAKNAFRDFAVSVLNDAARAFASKAVQQMLGLAFDGIFGGGLSATGHANGGAIHFASGGKVPSLLMGGEYVFSPQAARSVGYDTLNRWNRYAVGGAVVKGGSGVRDDVPAMLPQGSFVLRKSATSRLGIGYLDAAASGRMARHADGGVSWTNVNYGAPQSYKFSDTGFGSTNVGGGTNAAGSGSSSMNGMGGVWGNLAAGVILALASSIFAHRDKGSKAMSDSEVAAYAQKLQSDQQKRLDSRAPGTFAYKVSDGRGGYDYVGNGAQADVRRFNDGGAAMDSMPFFGAGFAGGGTVGSMGPTSSQTTVGDINISINNSSNSDSKDSGKSNGNNNTNDQELAMRMQKEVKKTVLQVLAEQSRSDGFFAQRQRYSVNPSF